MLPVQEHSFGDTDAARKRALRQPGTRPDRRDIDDGNFDMMDARASEALDRTGPGVSALTTG